MCEILVDFFTTYVFTVTATVKLGYNDHGYNEFMAIMNKNYRHFRSHLATFHYNLHGYSEQILMVP